MAFSQQDSGQFVQNAELMNEIIDEFNDLVKLDDSGYEQLIEYIMDHRELSDLINYIKKLDVDKINLEDLVDIIDDTSRETDAII